MLHHANRALRWNQNGLGLHNRLSVGYQITYHTVVLTLDLLGQILRNVVKEATNATMFC